MATRSEKNKKAKKKATKVPSKKWSIVPTVKRVTGSATELVFSWTNKKISNLANFSYEIWYYLPGVKAGVLDTSGTTTQHSVSYSMKENATAVVFKIKAVAKKHKVTWKEENKKGKKEKKSTEVFYWTGNWKQCKFTPSAYTAPVPSVSLDKTTLTASVSNLDRNFIAVRFQIWRDDGTVYKAPWADAKTINNVHYAEIKEDVPLGASYMVRCRVYTSKTEGTEWGEFSSPTGILPAAVKYIDKPTPLSSTSVKITWGESNGATSYELEYADSLDAFESGSPQSVTRENTSANVEGLERGKRWYFRVRAVRDSFKTPWTPSDVKDCPSILLGEDPAAPTTYSLSNSIKVGDTAFLYWVHNASDGSAQIKGEVHLEIHTGSSVIELDEVVNNPNYGDDLREDENLYLEIDTSDPNKYWRDKGVDFNSGMYIMWKVRTMGITGNYGAYSVVRRLDILSAPTLGLTMAPSETVTAFPITVNLSAGPASQNVIGYYIDVISDSNYNEVDVDGMAYGVTVGEKVYSQFIITDEREYEHVFTPANINLYSGASYRIEAAVSMDSGLTAVASATFDTDWSTTFARDAVPTAEFRALEDSYAMLITPFCYDSTDYDEGEGEFDPEEEVEVPLFDGVTLSVYRITAENELVEISSDIPNNGVVTVVDPHPTLVNPRYRIVARDDDTGEIDHQDIDSPASVYTSGIVITWGEEWDDVNVPPDLSDTDVLDDEGYYGNVLVLPYNASISENHQVDKALVSYIGRKRPVGYYGTQLGETSTWKAEFARYDSDIDPTADSDDYTLSLVRQLAIYPGDVYVRESNGSGYWASVDVQFDLSYNSLIVPVTFNVTRVEGGA
jgi:hypothetical protein